MEERRLLQRRNWPSGGDEGAHGDRALYFGDGIYEAACVANRVPFALEDHLDRMYNSLRLLEIPFRMERSRCGPSCRRSSKRRRRPPTTSVLACPGA